tara:strand:- start:1953 stop:2483 length:531 start_codon:yes stop_codon:yes gene_type:complete
VSYKPPKYIYFYLLFIFLVFTLSIFSNQTLKERNLGIYNINESSQSRLDLNIKNVSELEIEIIEIYQTNNQSLCKSGEIFIYGTLRNRVNNDIVRIRLQNIKVTNQLKIISKSTSIEPTRNYQQSPVVIVSENFYCGDEVITLIFEEKINISYVLIQTSKNYETYNQIKSINIKAY